MTIKEIEYLKSGSYIYIYDRWLKLSYDDEYRIAYTKDPFFKPRLWKSGDYYKLNLSRKSVYEFTAIRKYVYCIFCGGKYTPNQVVKNGKIILFPDIDTQIHILGFRDKGEHYIEISLWWIYKWSNRHLGRTFPNRGLQIWCRAYSLP